MNTSAFVQVRPVEAVTADTWEEIWQLTRRFYDTERLFVETRLRAHQKLALFRSAADRSLIGMAAIESEPLEFEGERLLMIFTSHTIVDERFRGQNLLQRAGLHTYLRGCLRHPLRRKFWIFDTFSYKSYLLLPRNLREFWPRHDWSTPRWESALMQHYGRSKYGDAWQADGVVRRSPQKRLLPHTAPFGTHLLANPDLAFYERVNPGHADGDMLLCLCPLSVTNWWSIVSRAVGRLWRRTR